MDASGLLKGRPTLSVRPSERRLRPRQRLNVRAGILTATGPKFAAEEVLVKGTLGEGSYGQVFEVSLHDCQYCIPVSYYRVTKPTIWHRHESSDMCLTSSPIGSMAV